MASYFFDENAIDNASASSFADKALVEAVSDIKDGLGKMIAAHFIKVANINLQNMIDDNDGNYQGMTEANPMNLHHFARQLAADCFEGWTDEVQGNIRALMKDM